MNKTKISDNQLFALAANFTIGTTVIAVSSGVAGLARQDAWISAIIAPLIGIPFILMYYYLSFLNPDKTLVDITINVFGKKIGWIISAFFVLFVCFMDAGQIIAYIGNFVQTEYMTETPLYAFNVLLTIALGIGLLYGLESIARSAEVFVLPITVLIILAMLMEIPNVQPNNLLPIFEKGITPTLKGTLYLSSYMTLPFIVLNMVYPSCKNLTSKSRNALIFGYIWGAIINFICTIMAILVLGSTITSASLFPTYLMAKEISVGIIDRIEGIISFSWIVTEFIKILLYLYTGVIGFSQLLGIKDYKKIVLPLMFIILIFSGVVYPNAAYQTAWDSTTWVPFIGTFGFVLPSILLCVILIKKLKKDSSENGILEQK